MWKSKIFHKSIMEYKKATNISEIIIINNDPTFNVPPYFKNKKIKILTQPENIYVNPAWNMGVDQSKNDYVVIANDDVYIKKLGWTLNVLKKHFKKYDLLGFNINLSNKTKIVDIKNLSETKKRPHGFGTFMVLNKKNYVTIPNEIKIWYGDDIQYYSIKKRGMFAVPSVEMEKSKTVKSLSNLNEIINKQDRPNYNKFIKDNNITLN